MLCHLPIILFTNTNAHAKQYFFVYQKFTSDQSNARESLISTLFGCQQPAIISVVESGADEIFEEEALT